MGKFGAVDLFAGVGGLSHGFASMPEFEILVANEYDPVIAAAYSLNHPAVEMISCDIRDLTAERLTEALGGRRVDLVIGGPPCQSYSTAGMRRMDGRAGLFREYRRILEAIRPTAFVFENVTGILSMDGGRLFEQVLGEFRSIGYEVRHEVLDAADYGVPQHRKRVILVGFLGENPYEYPEPTHGEGRRPWVTLRDAIGDLPPLRGGESSGEYLHGADNEFLRFVRRGGTTRLTEHEAPRNGERVMRIMEALGDGQGKADLPEGIRTDVGFRNSYAKLWWDRPSTTITRNFATPSSARCIHPRDSRAMTIREGARLQSFPDDYLFAGPASKRRLEIGNAVPPLLSRAIARQMLAALEAKAQEGGEATGGDEAAGDDAAAGDEAKGGQ